MIRSACESMTIKFLNRSQSCFKGGLQFTL